MCGGLKPPYGLVTYCGGLKPTLRISAYYEKFSHGKRFMAIKNNYLLPIYIYISVNMQSSAFAGRQLHADVGKPRRPVAAAVLKVQEDVRGAAAHAPADEAVCAAGIGAVVVVDDACALAHAFVREKAQGAAFVLIGAVGMQQRAFREDAASAHE